MVAAVGTALVAVGVFGLIHAAWITPIWPRLLGGLPLALVGALVLAWCYSSFLAAQRLPHPPGKGGLVFGLGAWVALIPATGASSILRLAGFHQAHASWSTAAELAIALVTGYAIGRVARLPRVGTVSTMAACAVLLSVQAGPVPVVNGWRALGLFLLLLPLYAVCGLIQAVQTAWLVNRSPSEPSPTAV
jgi:hypothetical protein